MEAWPVEEAYVVRPVGSLLLVALLPLGSRALVRAVLGEDSKAYASALTPIRATQLALAWILGATAVGPSLASSPISVEAHTAAVACICVAFVADGLVFPGATERHLRAGLMGALLASFMTAQWLGRAGVLAGAAVLFVTGWVAFHEPRSTETQASRLVGWVSSILLAALIVLPWTLTRIDPAEAASAGDSTWRLRIDPWDEHAMIANAWASRRRGELRLAHAQGREAMRMGLPEGPALELEAELLAARGRCDAARRMFDRALRARAEEAFGDEVGLTSPLLLGGYQLPPTLVTECDGLDQLPSIDEFMPR